MSIFKKKQNKTKQQIASEMKQMDEVKRLRKFSKEKFYPFLLEHTGTISEAKTFLQVIDTVVKGAFNEGLSTTTVGSLKIDEKIKNTAPDKEQDKYHGILEMFKDESVISFIRIVSDFQNTIGGLISEWERTGKLSDLKSPFPEEK